MYVLVYYLSIISDIRTDYNSNVCHALYYFLLHLRSQFALSYAIELLHAPGDELGHLVPTAVHAAAAEDDYDYVIAIVDR